MSRRPDTELPTEPREIRRGRSRAARLVANMVRTAQAFEDSGASLGDLKIVSRALEEMRRAFEMFGPYRSVRKVSAFGSARTQESDPHFITAERFAHAIAEQGFMVITGAGGGIMEACQRGAGRERSFGVNIQLPFEQLANPVIRDDPKLRSFSYFFTRKLFFILEAHAVVLFPGGFGTQDEGFEVLTLLQTGKCQMLPLVLLDHSGGTYWKDWQRYVEDQLLQRQLISPEDLHLYLVTDDVYRAVEEITRFYRVYHSSRYVDDLLVIRTTMPLPDPFLADLSREFAPIIERGEIASCPPFGVERDDPATLHLPRIAFHFDRRNFGLLRRLIDRINAV